MLNETESHPVSVRLPQVRTGNGIGDSVCLPLARTLVGGVRQVHVGYSCPSTGTAATAGLPVHVAVDLDGEGGGTDLVVARGETRVAFCNLEAGRGRVLRVDTRTLQSFQDSASDESTDFLVYLGKGRLLFLGAWADRVASWKYFRGIVHWKYVVIRFARLSCSGLHYKAGSKYKGEKCRSTNARTHLAHCFCWI